MPVWADQAQIDRDGTVDLDQVFVIGSRDDIFTHNSTHAQLVKLVFDDASDEQKQSVQATRTVHADTIESEYQAMMTQCA